MLARSVAPVKSSAMQPSSGCFIVSLQYESAAKMSSTDRDLHGAASTRRTVVNPESNSVSRHVDVVPNTFDAKFNSTLHVRVDVT
jgi:hypothetical protein